MNIRELQGEADRRALRECVVELQDFERQIDARMPHGEAIADSYIDEMMARCDASRGKILVADVDGEVGGYVTVLTRVRSGELDDGDIEYGLIADLLVRARHRGAGMARKMLQAAEAVATQHGVRWLRITVLAANRVARELYASSGYTELYVDFEKDLGDRACQ